MTIKELRQLIANFPDDADVIMYHINYKGWETVSGVTAYSDKVTKVRDEGDGPELKEEGVVEEDEEEEDEVEMTEEEKAVFTERYFPVLTGDGYSSEEAAAMIDACLNGDADGEEAEQEDDFHIGTGLVLCNNDY